MYLNRLIERNPGLLEYSIELHQSGQIPPNTWIVDLDAIAENARVLSAEAKRLNLTTYLMSKQFGRNPYINHLAIACGLYKTVAVDIQGALLLRRYDVPIGHIGHLNQVPRLHVRDAVTMHPDVITVYNIDHAQWINDVAATLGTVQNLLIRVYAPNDIFFDGQEGGIAESDVPDVVEKLRELEHVQLVGVTAFPCVRYNARSGDTADLTPNFRTILRAAETMRSLGVDVTQINAPGNTSTATMQMLADGGATHVEPGHGLLGTTPSHSFNADLPERPAYVYVSEVSHHVDDRAYAFGGGLFRDIYDPEFRSKALVGASWRAAQSNAVDFRDEISQVIDYHAVLEPGSKCTVGDTALFGFRTQMQMTRSYVLPISGLSSGNPVLHHLFDHANTALDADFNPVDVKIVREDVQVLLEKY